LLNTILGTLSSGVAASTSSYESIASATGTGSSGTITFSSIPQTYASLQLRWQALSTPAYVLLNVNGAVPSYLHYLYGSGSAAGANGAASFGYLSVNEQTDTTNPYVGITDFIDYASTTKNKTIRNFSGKDSNGGGEINLMSYLINSTTAITSISVIAVTQNWATTTQVSLYGIKG
jgi:hypothetical protein